MHVHAKSQMKLYFQISCLVKKISYNLQNMRYIKKIRREGT